jgi:menaquinone-specific isochorismate synthase
VFSEAVAGTRGRGETPDADAALREELLTSEKERREHAFVQRALEEALRTLCTTVDGADTPSDLALARGRHLHAPIRGTLRPETSTVDLLEALHPTPAVGGVPRGAALTAIREQEPFDRGWYAGPVGWMGPDAADFAVGIRSGLLHPDRLALFSGAGIVEGSRPDREWAEIEQKIADFAAVLGLLRPQDEARL